MGRNQLRLAKPPDGEQGPASWSPPEIRPYGIRVAADRAECEAAYRLVHEVYLQSGFIRRHPARLRYLAHFGLPESRTLIVAASPPKIVGTLTLVPDGLLGEPMDATFQGELEAVRRKGRRLAEVASLAIRTPAGVSSQRLFFRLTQYVLQYADARGIDDLVISVHPRHSKLYRRLFTFRPISPCVPCLPVGGQPAIACLLDMHEVRDKRDRDPLAEFFEETISPSQFASPGMDRGDHLHFCALMGWPLPAMVGIGEQELRRSA